MKPLLLFIIIVVGHGCNTRGINPVAEEQKINVLLDAWHASAGKAEFDNYFDAMSEDAIFMGTDATEHWTKKEFMVWARPYFDKGKAWSFTSLERHVYFSDAPNIAWFDELLNTQMKICRGSGVLIKEGEDWKILQYVLSMTVPNDVSDEVVGIKSSIENNIIDELKK